ncbi:MAG: hypothetical protein SWK90_00640 [Chloroflexota bacterium]|nr:hypothetical protein [Chloroflexota bacterium]
MRQGLVHSVEEVALDKTFDFVPLFVEDAIDAKVQVGAIELKEFAEQGL